jgi:hypothetical protein
MVIKKARQIEIEERTEPKLDLSILRKKSTAKTPSNLILSYMKSFKKDGNLEMAILFQEIFKKIKAMETSEKFKQENWKNKSGLNFLIKPDKVICISHQKFEPGEKPKEIRTELTREEINKVIGAINKLNKDEYIPTSELAEETYKTPWKKVFSNRQQHIKFTKILNYLEFRKDIEYSRVGKIKVLRKIYWW